MPTATVLPTLSNFAPVAYTLQALHLVYVKAVRDQQDIASAYSGQDVCDRVDHVAFIKDRERPHPTTDRQPPHVQEEHSG